MYFYAAGGDLLDVARLVLDETDCLLYESDSEINQALRQLDGGNLAPWIERQRLTGSVGLAAWSPAMRQQMHIATVTLKTAEGGERQRAVGWGLIYVHLFDVRGGRLGRSSVNANSENRARRWEDVHLDLGPVDAWDWAGVERTLRRIERLIRVRLVVAKDTHGPMLLAARDALSSGAGLRLW